MISLTKNKIQIFPIFFKIQTTRLHASFEGLNNSIAQSACLKFNKKSGTCGT